ncbi:hypothetical protein, partial [Salmonella enterica]|uniref:hypothetical protein n=1 Tax=Salmonella enterica TaxID=28901 RepID=UPI0020C364A5
GYTPPSGSLPEFSTGKLRHQVNHLCYFNHYLLQWRRCHREEPDLYLQLIQQPRGLRFQTGFIREVARASGTSACWEPAN